MLIIFCDNLIDKKVDHDFQDEYNAACAQGFKTALISYEDLLDSNVAKSILRVPRSSEQTKAIYRGWMMSPEIYEILYENLLTKNVALINTPAQYKTCHYLPFSYPFIKEFTPFTKWLIGNNNIDFNDVFEITDTFGCDPIIVKDFVKSQKHNWDEACFIPDASDHNSVRKVVMRFLELQGASFSVGLVFRKFEQLEHLTVHSKSQMPLTKEFRLFFLNGKVLQTLQYWDEGDYGNTLPDVHKFTAIGAKVDSVFFTMDIAKKHNGDWIIMELGDGQVSGLPANAETNNFYKALKENSQTLYDFNCE